MSIFWSLRRDIPAISAVLTTAGYGKCAENAIFSRWKHPSLSVDDVDVMYVNRATFEKLLEGSVIHHLGTTALRVPSVPSLIALKLHAIRSNPDRLEKDGRDIADLLLRQPLVLNKPALQTLFAKYGCSPYFPQFSHLVS